MKQTETMKSKCHCLVNAMLNANNTEYESELTLRHQGDYEQGRCSCHKEMVKSSVCNSAVPNEFFACLNNRRRNTDKMLRKKLLPAWDRLQQHVVALGVIADAVDKVHREATIANVAGGRAGITGKITHIVARCLVPETFVACLMLSSRQLVIYVVGSVMDAAVTVSDITLGSQAKKRERGRLQDNGQAVLKQIQKCIKQLSNTTGFRKQF
ncbi:PREDICTED: uncharacterized protein LOC109323179 [Crocodylus porosus]|uniref:uncharacterized protein LOC109323179 n=1 Tax=Crocodylus porosus TaxID=8502 RepID=UPI00093B6834|nr:PREDICTED: uncharacterized protein LOC109323179 [Crocodylus porosus]